MEFYVLIVSVLFLAYWYFKNARSWKYLPPGPVGIPLLGYMPFMEKNQHLQFSKLKEKYGDIFCFNLGQQLFVVLSSYAVLKEALIKQGNNFAGRPIPLSMIPPELSETNGITMSSGKLHTEFKHVALSVIKTFSKSNGTGESIVTNEIKYLLREIDQHLGKPIDVAELISSNVINIIWYCLFAERTDKNDDKFKALLQNTHTRADTIQLAGIEFAFPQIFHIPFASKIFQASIAIDCYRDIYKYFNDKINQIEKSEPISEFNFVQEWFKLHPKDSADYDFYRKQLPPVIVDLFGAGIETTTVTLQWAILYMMLHPDIQKKVQTEINEVIGKLNKPSMMDKNKMPFTEATLMEVHRISSIVPFSLPHANQTVTTISDYTIPENSIILPNIWEIHHNPETFPDPQEFRPERFLENGEFKKMEEVIPFSIGKRQCLGEALARMELFLIFTSLLQRYTLKKPDGVQLDFSYDFSLVLSPRPYEVVAIPN